MVGRLLRDERGLATNEKRMLALLGVVALGALIFLLRPGGDASDAFDDRPPLPQASQPAEQPPAAPRTTGEAFEGRDPFQPLVQPPPPPSNGGIDGGDGGNGDDRNVVDGGDVIVVGLVEIFTQDGTRYATVEVDGRGITVAEGDRFAGSFRVLELTKRCGTFVFGDERFTLCVGQEVRK